MARPAGFEPATHGLDVPGTTSANNKLSHYYGAHTRPILEKHAKPCKPMQSFVCPVFVPNNLAISSPN
ncbi:hypothetical protein DTU84_06340 [Salmonella enterica subsp. enterica serovar Cubana]|nr:hypothetical protein [Salmonella enterica subsp. enterica serovar Cubana]